jgi:hypothetical protein
MRYYLDEYVQYTISVQPVLFIVSYSKVNGIHVLIFPDRGMRTGSFTSISIALFNPERGYIT